MNPETMTRYDLAHAIATVRTKSASGLAQAIPDAYRAQVCKRLMSLPRAKLLDAYRREISHRLDAKP